MKKFKILKATIALALVAFALVAFPVFAANAPAYTNGFGQSTYAVGQVCVKPGGGFCDPSAPALAPGAATSALQTTGNTSLNNIDVDTSTIITNTASTVTNTAATNTALAGYLSTTSAGPHRTAIAQTVTASSAYTSGNAIGGLMTVTNAVRSSGVTSLLQSVVVNYKSAQTGQVDVFIFNANPSSSTCTDKAAFVLASADFDKVTKVVNIITSNAGNVSSEQEATNLAKNIIPTSGTSIYSCAVTRATPTFASTSDVNFQFDFIWN